MARFFMSFVFHRPFSVEGTLKVLMENGYLQLALTSAHLLIVVVIVAKGVQEGIEKWVGFMMPVFFVLMMALLIQSMLLPSANEAIQFLFYPDFSKLRAGSLGQALGHVLFTLSLGFGTMVVFGSYLRDDVHIPSAGFRVALIDTTLSLLAGLLIFPIVFADTGVDPNNLRTGPELLFETLPILFHGRGGALWGTAFFLCLYLAAVGASIGLLEASVSNLIDLGKLKRIHATWITAAVCLLFAVFPALSSTVFRGVRYKGMGLLAIVDAVLITGILPFVGLGFSLAVGWKMKESLVKEQFIRVDRQASVRLYPHWRWLLRWFLPALILLAFLIELVGFWLTP
jgi:NSS family neurotransmitter:Na+ symporter